MDGPVQPGHEGLGLGHRFLRHVERTRVLLHLVSAEDTAPETLFEAFGVVDEELRLFDPGLAARPQIRVVNKIDLLSSEDLAARRQAAEASGLPVLFMRRRVRRFNDFISSRVSIWRHSHVC